MNSLPFLSIECLNTQNSDKNKNEKIPLESRQKQPKNKFVVWEKHTGIGSTSSSSRIIFINSFE